MMTDAFWWAMAGIVLMLSEFAVPGLILFFFGWGALFTALVCWMLPGLSLHWQIGLFTLFSLGSLFGLRRFLKKVFTGRSSGTGAAYDEQGLMVGARGEVTEPIEPGRYGRVTINGAGWKAVAKAPISKGELVEAVEQQNLTLTVQPVTEGA